jgi:hypothetical protein
MTDEQRKEYVEHMRQLDTIQGKPGVVKEAPKPAANGKPYKDPVLEKALEHLRKQLREVGAAPATRRNAA